MRPDTGWSLQPMTNMSAAEFDDWCQLLEERSGIVWHEDRKTYLEVRLTARMRELGISDYGGYYRQVREGVRGALEWASLLDRLTVQETRFFRHQASFDHVGQFLRKRTLERQQSMSLWSVGCSTGEESWSLAMTAAEATAGNSQAGFSILATDVSRTALATAREGYYSTSRSQQVAEVLRERYLPVEADGRHRICEALRSRACFSRVNILELEEMPVLGMDVIFCQNVLIYFRRWKRRNILSQLVERLLPGGLLVLGLGEVSGWQHPQLEPVDNDKILAFVRKGY